MDAPEFRWRGLRRLNMKYVAGSTSSELNPRWYESQEAVLASSVVNLLIGVVGIVPSLRRLLKKDLVAEEAAPQRHGGLSGVVSFSACKIAAWRALESELGEKALFSDPLAAELAGPQALADARSRMAKSEGPPSRLAIRTRYFDDAMQRAVVGQAPGDKATLYSFLVNTLTTTELAQQIVMIGAGMDTRVYRLQGDARRKVVAYEVDVPEVLQAKQAVLDECARRGTLPSLTLASSRVTVGADLNNPAWFTGLIAAGFRPELPTVWLAEGLLMYLEPEAVERLSETLYDLSAPHSVLLVSMVNSAAVAKAKASNSELMQTWKWGVEDPKAFFQRQGWSVQSVVQVGAKQANYGRWKDPIPEPSATGVGRTLYVTATKSTPSLLSNAISGSTMI